jgi:uncharacterized protein YegP (UPF0339 family)
MDPNNGSRFWIRYTGSRSTKGGDEMAKFVIYKDVAGKYRWRLVASNGEKVATSGEAFASQSNAARAARGVKRVAPVANTP